MIISLWSSEGLQHFPQTSSWKWHWQDVLFQGQFSGHYLPFCVACMYTGRQERKEYFVLNSARYIFFFVINFCFSSTHICVEKQFLSQSCNLQKAKIAAFEVRVFEIESLFPPKACTLLLNTKMNTVGKKRTTSESSWIWGVFFVFFFFYFRAPSFFLALISQGRNLIDYKCFVMMSLEPIDFSHLFLDNTRSAGKHQ